jgi:Family of unknown function (DUF5681)
VEGAPLGLILLPRQPPVRLLAQVVRLKDREPLPAQRGHLSGLRLAACGLLLCLSRARREPHPPRGIRGGVAVRDSLTTGTGAGKPSQVGYGNPPAEHRFRKGQSGNPGGRPKGLARITRELLGDDGETAVRFLVSVMDGGPLPDGAIPSVSERITAAKLLIERGWGRAPEFAPLEDRDPLELRGGDEELAASFDRRMDELAEKRVERERQHEAG